MTQIPRGPDNLWCPLWRKKMVNVCHTCPWWTYVRGQNPQTGDMVDDWKCAIGHGPMLSIEIAAQNRQIAAEINKTRNMAIESAKALERSNGNRDHQG